MRSSLIIGCLCALFAQQTFGTAAVTVKSPGISAVEANKWLIALGWLEDKGNSKFKLGENCFFWQNKSKYAGSVLVGLGTSEVINELKEAITQYREYVIDLRDNSSVDKATPEKPNKYDIALAQGNVARFTYRPKEFAAHARVENLHPVLEKTALPQGLNEIQDITVNTMMTDTPEKRMQAMKNTYTLLYKVEGTKIEVYIDYEAKENRISEDTIARAGQFTNFYFNEGYVILDAIEPIIKALEEEGKKTVDSNPLKGFSRTDITSVTCPLGELAQTTKGYFKYSIHFTPKTK